MTFETNCLAHPATSMTQWAIVVHGGAGAIARQRLRPEQDAAYRAALGRAIDAGSDVLSSSGRSVSAVEAAICAMEDDPLFNAGRGAVFTETGSIELDASIMDGRTRAAGAVAGITRTRHPISVARRVMEDSPHVMLIAPGADAFARAQGLEQVEPEWFYTRPRWHALERFLRHAGLVRPPPPSFPPLHDLDSLVYDEGKFGTAGAVALDVAGNLAAGTSTGGTTGKRWSRVGDSPLIGAGTYAANAACAVSATGSGEHLIRLCAAREVCALIEHRSLSVQAAADEVVRRRLAALGGDGGVIALAANGKFAWSFNTTGMYRAHASADTRPTIAIYDDEA